MMASVRTDNTSSGKISGVGLANAKINGCLAIFFTMAGFSTPPADKPRKISAPSITSSKVRAEVFWTNWILSSSINSVRPSYTTPAKSVTKILLLGTPIFTSRPKQASAAAPAPDVTSLTFFKSLPATLMPFKMAAPTTIAVPCWSS